MFSNIIPQKRRIFHAGAIPNMLVNNQFLKCVCFLCIDKQNEERKMERTPAATSFLVSVPIGDDIEQICAVTARHVIDRSRAYPLYLRLRLTDGNVEDILVPQDNWTCHPITDVAVIPVDIPDNADVKYIPLEMLITDGNIADGGVGLGDDIVFVGLFTEYSGSKHDRPIIRFGNISLMHEEMPLTLTPGCDPIQTDAYLVEARSWGGESGSPAFVYYAVDREPGIITVGGFDGKQFALLGLTHGHWEMGQDVLAPDGNIIGSGKVSVNSGIAAIIPAQKIIDTLMKEELEEDRKKDLTAYRKRAKTPHPDIGLDEKTITKKRFHDIYEVLKMYLEWRVRWSLRRWLVLPSCEASERFGSK